MNLTPPLWIATSSGRSWSLRARAAARACADLAAGAEWAAGLRGHRRGHRAPQAGARTPDADHHPQGRQGRHHPLAPRTGRAIDLAISERTDGPVFLPVTGGGWTDTAPGGSSAGRAPSRDQRACRPAHAAARVHHGQFRRRSATARRPRGRFPLRPADHHEIRPCPRQPGPARHLHRRRLRRGRRPLTGRRAALLAARSHQEGKLRIDRERRPRPATPASTRTADMGEPRRRRACGRLRPRTYSRITTSSAGHGGPERSAPRRLRSARCPFGSWSPGSQRCFATTARTSPRQS